MRLSARASRRRSTLSVRSILLGCLFAAGVACSTAATPKESTTPGPHRRDGELAIAASTRESGETIRWEKGAVTHGGAVTSFTVKGLEVGSSGFEGLVVLGEVYDLDRAGDLAGTYQRVLADVTPTIGSGSVVLANEHGVILVLRSADGASPVGPAPEGMVVELVR